MSDSLAQPSILPARGFFARTWADPDGRSTLVGVGGVIIFYLLLGATVPFLPKMLATPSVPRPKATKRFSINLAPPPVKKAPEKAKPKPPPPNKFVETNPDAPENIPDKTNNFAAQNQQVAQEKPAVKNESDMPASAGKKDFESNQIVSGQLTKPVEQMEATPPPPDLTSQPEKKPETARQEQNPLKGFEKKQGDNPDGFASNIAKAVDNAKLIPEAIAGQKNIPFDPNATAVQAIDPTRPRPRPSLVKQQQVRPAILAERLAGTTNIGPTSVDAHWSNYGAYLQRMIESVQIQWERLIVESKVSVSSGSTVTVKFIMDSKGQIAKIVNLESTASDAASRACVSAISDRSPYGEWTEDMKAVLGEQQEMTFSFYYQ